MKQTFLLLIANIVFLVIYCQPSKSYYVSSYGNDANNGLSKTNPWKSLDKINKTNFNSGDSIFLEGGKTFNGSIFIDSLDSGLPGNPVTFLSYGSGDAVIDAANTNGLLAYNVSNISLIHLYFKGNGVTKNNGMGIYFYSDKTNEQCSSIVIDHCTAKGFHNEGILFSCAEGEHIKGFNNVKITNCVATENGQAGMGSYGGQTSFHHTNFYIANCTTFLNRGILAKTENHSGNGIVMGGIENLLISQCQAYNNGADNRCTAGGPVGIWVWLCKNAVIENCESHHNHAGLTKDGGGFDIDGGSQNCTIQYCYSHNNEGAGFLLAEYGAGLPFTNNTIRFNISENDGRKNGYGGISFWGAGDNYQVTNTYVYNNTVYIDDKNLVNGKPGAVTTMGKHFLNVLLANNIFTISGNAHFLNSDENLDTSRFYSVNNNYYSYNNQYLFQYKSGIINSLSAGLLSNPGQETLNLQPVWINVNPGFLNPGEGYKISGPHKMKAQLNTYHLQKPSTLNNGINLLQQFSIDIGSKDFYGNSVDRIDRFVGAAKK